MEGANFNWGRIMPFDEKKIDSPMSRIEVAEVMLAVLGALQATRWALASIKRGDDPQENIDILAKEVEALNADGRISQAGGRRLAIDESMKPQGERERKERTEERRVGKECVRTCK